MGSYTLRTTLVMACLDVVFNLLLAVCFRYVFSLEAEAAHAFYRILFWLYLPRTAVWLLLRVRMVAPLDRWLSRRPDETWDDEQASSAARAIYNFPLYYTIFYSCLFFVMYAALAVILSLADTPARLGPDALIPGLLFAATVGFGGFAVGFPLNLFLFAPIAGRISIPAEKRGLELPGVWVSIRSKMVVLGLCLALSPCCYFIGIQAILRSAQEMNESARTAELVLAHLDSPESWQDAEGVYPFLATPQGGLVQGDKLTVLLRERPALARWFTQSVSEGASTNRSQRAVLRTRLQGDQVVGVVVLAAGATRTSQVAIALAALVAVAWGLGSALLMSHTVANPLARIADTVRKIVVRGEVDAGDRVPVFFKDEVGQLAGDTNRMIDRLVDSRHKLGQSLARLEDQNDELERAYRIKGQFLANMSHELRTPLNAIIGFSKLMLRKTQDKLPERQYKNLQLIHQSGRQLLTLVNDILDFERIEAGRMVVSPSEVDCRALAEELRDTLTPQAEEKGMTMEFRVEQEPMVLYLDPDRLRQVLINLLTNAIKYSDSGNILSTFGLRGREVVLAVQDQGLGIGPEQLKRIFEPFHQVDASHTREREGAGLGLAIVDKLATLMGGRMQVESELGVGSTFSLIFPDTVLVGDQERGLEALKPKGAGPDVLVIDDQASFLEVMYSELSEAGYRVHLARSGEEGLARLASLRPSAVLLDIVMPGMGGWEVLKRIRANPQTSSIPVIITSVLDNSPVGYDLGIAAWLTKPVDASRFQAVLQDLAQEGTVLVVEDDVGTRGLLEQELDGMNARFISVATGQEALDFFAQQLPSAVVLDLGLPDMEGFQVLEGLRRLDPRVPVVIYTARDLGPEDYARLDQVAEVVHKHGADSPAAVLAALGLTAGPQKPVQE
ncbi:MAG: response regulator [Vulcanimicrobiota bacterium]